MLFFLTGLVAACGGGTSQNVPGTPAATLTIVFNQQRTSPIPARAPYACGGWATDATIAYTPNGAVNVYGKFTQLDTNANPVGVAGATATATVHWPDGSTQSLTTTTTSDGLATFTVPLKASAINRIVLIHLTFVKGTLTCSIAQDAFFTAIIASPTPAAGMTPTLSPTLVISPSPTPILSPTPCRRRKCLTPTPTP